MYFPTGVQISLRITLMELGNCADINTLNGLKEESKHRYLQTSVEHKAGYYPRRNFLKSIYTYIGIGICTLYYYYNTYSLSVKKITLFACYHHTYESEIIYSLRIINQETIFLGLLYNKINPKLTQDQNCTTHVLHDE